MKPLNIHYIHNEWNPIIRNPIKYFVVSTAEINYYSEHVKLPL